MSGTKRIQKTIKKEKNPTIGEIWAVAIPEYYVKDDDTFGIEVNIRPFLVLDDGRGLIVEENNDYHCFKLTRQTKQKVKPIKNWKEKGLKAKSYYRIEMPIKVEIQQFIHKITELTPEEMIDVYKDLFNYINVKSIEKIANKEKEESTK